MEHHRGRNLIERMDYQKIIDKYYPVGIALRDIFLNHSKSVADLAVEINDRKKLGLNPETVYAAGMLHDIGIFLTDAPGIECHGEEPYIRHGILGAELLRLEGAEEMAKVAERHTGSGITEEEIDSQKLPLPKDRSYVPESLLEKLICYADKFYSKSGDGKRKQVDEIERSMKKHSESSWMRFEELHKLFG